MHHQVSVSPLHSFRAFYISDGNIHSSNESSLAIYNAQLTVVAIVHLTGKSRKLHRHKGVNIYALIAHTLIETITNIPIAHIVIYHSHLYTLSCLVYQSISDERTQWVFLKDIKFNMYMFLCFAYFL